MCQLHHRYKLFCCILILLIAHSSDLVGQDDCNCKSGEQITVCYYSANKFCPPDAECRYTFDGDFMENSLRRKLQNPELFGVDGISKCPIELKIVEDVNTVGYIEQQNCEIMFVGAFTDIVNGEFLPSSIPLSELIVIKEWSTKCPSNLTIVSQVEAAPWGYRFEDLNENPNSPDPQFSEFSIFNGSFGKITSFQQGGSFQGIFVGYPTTGYSILARDNNSEPTIVLDSLSNDIVLGDIGILCTIAGPLSTGENIENDSDILACNLFDLGCKIATNSSTDFVDICIGETYITPLGNVISDAGVYVDSLLNQEGCDSLIYTILEINPDLETIYSQRICDDDSYQLLVGSTIYGVSNLTGVELLESEKGCDSTVFIELFYNKSDSTYISETICQGEVFTIEGTSFDQTLYVEFPLTNEQFCDSTIFLDLTVQEPYNTTLTIDLCPGEEYITDQGVLLNTAGVHTEVFSTIHGCDSTSNIHILIHDTYQQFEEYFGCKGDQYSLTMGSTTYNESNTNGIEHLQSSKGCDSIINVSFVYESLDSTYLDVELCPYETVEVAGVSYDGNLSEVIIIPSSRNCDSLIFLEVETYETTDVRLDNFYEVNLNSEFSFDLPEVDSSIYLWDSDGVLSCNNCPDPSLILGSLPTYVELSYSDEFDCQIDSRAVVTYRCTPFFPNIMSPSSISQENRSFGVTSLCPFDDYELNVFDRWGNRVFSSTDQNESWDGRHLDKYADQGVYVYAMKYSVNGSAKELFGSVTIVR